MIANYIFGSILVVLVLIILYYLYHKFTQLNSKITHLNKTQDSIQNQLTHGILVDNPSFNPINFRKANSYEYTDLSATEDDLHSHPESNHFSKEDLMKLFNNNPFTSFKGTNAQSNSINIEEEDVQLEDIDNLLEVDSADGADVDGADALANEVVANEVVANEVVANEVVANEVVEEVDEVVEEEVDEVAEEEVDEVVVEEVDEVVEEEVDEVVDEEVDEVVEEEVDEVVVEEVDEVEEEVDEVVEEEVDEVVDEEVDEVDSAEALADEVADSSEDLADDVGVSYVFVKPRPPKISAKLLDEGTLYPSLNQSDVRYIVKVDKNGKHVWSRKIPTIQHNKQKLSQLP